MVGFTCLSNILISQKLKNLLSPTRSVSIHVRRIIVLCTTQGISALCIKYDLYCQILRLRWATISREFDWGPMGTSLASLLKVLLGVFFYFSSCIAVMISLFILTEIHPSSVRIVCLPTMVAFSPSTHAIFTTSGLVYHISCTYRFVAFSLVVVRELHSVVLYQTPYPIARFVILPSKWFRVLLWLVAIRHLCRLWIMTCVHPT